MADEHSDSLRAALEASFTADGTSAGPGEGAGGTGAGAGAGAGTGAGAGVPDGGQQASGDADGRQRDASGRFSGTGADSGGAALAGEPAAPEGYSADLWSQLSPEARRATAEYAGKQRETLAERDARLEGYKPIDAVLAARRDSLTAQYGGVDKALEQLFHLSDWAGRDMPGFLRHMVQQQRLDPSVLFPAQQGGGSQGQGQGQTGAGQPDLGTLVAQAVQQKLQEAEIDRGYAAFASDATLLHRNDPGIRKTMAALLQGEAATDYRQAYDMAAQAHPTIGPKLREAQAAQAAKDDAARRVKALEGKASAAVSLTGAPGTSRSAPAAAPDSIRAGLEAHWATSGGRA